MASEFEPLRALTSGDEPCIELHDANSGVWFFPEEDDPLDPKVEALIPKRAQSPAIVAIVDTGLLHEHPWVKGAIVAEVDMTGEGPEDFCGHGTAAALAAVGWGVRRGTQPRLVNVKVAGRGGLGTGEWLIEGLRWLKDFKKDLPPEEHLFVNLSMGTIPKRRFGGLLPGQCDGSCPVCEAAIDLARTGVNIAVAAGNFGPENTTCPANAALKRADAGPITAMGASDYPQSGRGNLSAPGNVRFVAEVNIASLIEDYITYRDGPAEWRLHPLGLTSEDLRDVQSLVATVEDERPSGQIHEGVKVALESRGYVLGDISADIGESELIMEATIQKPVRPPSKPAVSDPE